MKKSFIAFVFLLSCAGLAVAQKGTAEPDYYPMGYSGDTWTGEVTAFDNARRTLTLTYVREIKISTFIASIPDAPYEWGHDARKFRVVDFPYDKEAKVQLFKYVAAAGFYVAPPGYSATGTPVQRRPNPPVSNVISEFGQFMGHAVTVYYTTRERTVGDKKEKYNDVWRIRVLPGKTQ